LLGRGHQWRACEAERKHKPEVTAVEVVRFWRHPGLAEHSLFTARPYATTIERAA
jgi:hypothetical protein